MFYFGHRALPPANLNFAPKKIIQANTPIQIAGMSPSPYNVDK